MTDKAIDTLRELAGKLGQTVEALWPVATRYVAVDAAVSVAVGLVTSMGMVAAALYLRTAYLRLTDERKVEVGPLLIGSTIFCVVVALLTATGVMTECLPSVLEPTGALVHRILGVR